MAVSFSSYVPDARRIRNLFLRLPLASRVLLAVITALYIAHFLVPRITDLGALVPNQVNFQTRMFALLCLCIRKGPALDDRAG